MPEHKPGPERQSNSDHKANGLRIITCEGLAAFEEAIRKAIAYRAYEIYEGHGRSDGSDMGDWFSAERELVKPSNVEISESGRELRVSADIGGFENIQLGVSPRRLIVWGDAAGAAQGLPGHMLGEIPLPFAIDPGSAEASIKGTELTFHAPKPSI